MPANSVIGLEMDHPLQCTYSLAWIGKPFALHVGTGMVQSDAQKDVILRERVVEVWLNYEPRTFRGKILMIFITY